MVIAIDFDGTIVTHMYPSIGEPVKGAISVIKNLIANDHKIVLYTMRSGMYLNDAVAYLKNEGIELFGINHNPEQDSWTTSPKAYAQLYIDDAALGCPLITPNSPFSRPYVDWLAVNKELTAKGIL